MLRAPIWILVCFLVEAAQASPVTQYQLGFRHEEKNYAIWYMGVLIDGEVISSGVYILPSASTDSYSLAVNPEKKWVALERTTDRSQVSKSKAGLYFVGPASEVHCIIDQFEVPGPADVMRGGWEADIKRRFVTFLANQKKPNQSPEPMAVLRTAMAHL